MINLDRINEKVGLCGVEVVKSLTGWGGYRSFNSPDFGEH